MILDDKDTYFRIQYLLSLQLKQVGTQIYRAFSAIDYESKRQRKEIQ